MIHKIFKFILTALIIAAAIAGFNYLKATRPAPPSTKIAERVWQVEVEAAKIRTLSPIVSLYGRVETPNLFKAAAPTSARVAEVLVKEGQRVKSGQKLITLDEQDFLPPLNQAKAAVAELEAQLQSESVRYEADRAALEQEERLLALANAAVQRARTLRKQRLNSEADLEQTEQASVRQALVITSRNQGLNDHSARKALIEAKLRGAKAKVDDLTVDYTRSRISAPYAGVIASVTVTTGDQVNANTTLLSMYATASLEVRAKIPVPYQTEIQQAFAAGLTLTGVSNFTGTTTDLVLNRLAGTGQISGLDAILSIESGQESLRPGQLLLFNLLRPPHPNAIAMPYQAVYGGDHIYTLHDGRLRQHKVKILGNAAAAISRDRLLLTADKIVAGDLLVLTHLPNAITGLRIEALQPKIAADSKLGNPQ